MFEVPGPLRFLEDGIVHYATPSVMHFSEPEFVVVCEETYVRHPDPHGLVDRKTPVTCLRCLSL